MDIKADLKLFLDYLSPASVQGMGSEPGLEMGNRMGHSMPESMGFDGGMGSGMGMSNGLGAGMRVGSMRGGQRLAGGYSSNGKAFYLPNEESH